MRRLVELASRPDLKPFEDAWVETIANDPSDVNGLLEAISGLESQGQFHKAAGFLSLLLPAFLDNADKNDEALLVLERLAKLSPRDKKLRENFLKVFRRVHDDHEGFDQLVKHSGIETDMEVAKAAEKLGNYLEFKPGAYVEHPAGWGVGIVATVDADNATVTIDFRELAGHELEIDVACNITRHLATDSFKAMKFDRLDKLLDMVENDPVALVKCVVVSRDRTTTVRDLRERLTEGVIATKEWSKWWSKTRAKVKRDPNVKMTTGNNPAIEVTVAEQAFEDSVLVNMRALKTLPKKIKYVRELFVELDSHPETQPALMVAAGVLAKSAAEERERYPGATISLAFMLERIAKLEEGYTIPEDLRIDSVLEDPWKALELLGTVPIAADRKETLVRLKERFPEEWLEIFEKALYVGESDVNDLCLKELVGGGAFDRVTRIIFEFLNRFRDHRSSFLWFVKTAVKGGIHKALPNPGLKSLLEKTILLHSHVLNRLLQTEDAELKKELKNIERVLTARNSTFVRKALDESDLQEAATFYNLVRGSRSLPDDVKDVLVAAILRTRPEVAKLRAEQEEAEAIEAGVVIDDKIIYVTEAGFIRYEEEYNRVVNDEIPKNTAEIERAASFGDLSENAEWSAAIEKQGVLSQKAVEMRDALDRARIIDESLVQDEAVAIGCIVDLANLESNAKETYTLLGPWDVDTSKGIISYQAPLGKALLGKAAGEEIEVQLPGGSSRYRVESISIAHSAFESTSQSAD